MSLVYAAALVLSGACLVLLDLRFALVMRRRPAAAAIALVAGLAFFIAWDAAGIALGVFRHVDSRWASGATYCGSVATSPRPRRRTTRRAGSGTRRNRGGRC